MTIAQEFLVKLIVLTEDLNKESEKTLPAAYYPPSYHLSILYPVGENHYREDSRKKGWHCRLSAIYDPVSEEMPVENTVVSLIVEEKYLVSVFFEKGFEREEIDKIELEKDKLNEITAQIKDFFKTVNY
ncbi:MAG TPA: hypothetical protein DHW82_00535 [Spirochaetia bacterium]|nr:MAG: hypothetical protein A2Y41_04350 [Spirochaetes bacterium GWB1_36_13]HCL55486.1 hypothetical protein [Spirochaetia bacterium]